MSYTPRGAHAEDLCRLASLSGNSSGNIPARVRHRECITMYASRNLITRYIIGIGRRRIFSAPRVAAMPHWTRSNRMPNRRMPHRGGIRERDRSASVGSLLSLPSPPLPPSRSTPQRARRASAASPTTWIFRRSCRAIARREKKIASRRLADAIVERARANRSAPYLPCRALDSCRDPRGRSAAD